MIQISSRYALALLLLALVAAVPVYLHTAGRLNRDDCADPGALLATLLIEGSRPEPVERELGPLVLQRSEGTVAWDGEGAPPLRFAIVRTFSPMGLASRPHAAVSPSFEAADRSLEWTERGGERLPIQWLFDRSTSAANFAAYVFIHESEPVARPLLAILASAPRQLIGGARPLTLLAIAGQTRPRQMDEAQRAAEAWLFAAWQHYRAVCLP